MLDENTSSDRIAEAPGGEGEGETYLLFVAPINHGFLCCLNLYDKGFVHEQKKQTPPQRVFVYE
jgi:hypothetical protein